MLVLRSVAPEKPLLLLIQVAGFSFPIHLLYSLLFLCRLHLINLTFSYSMTLSERRTQWHHDLPSASKKSFRW
jgi:hypothetical protein